MPRTDLGTVAICNGCSDYHDGPPLSEVKAGWTTIMDEDGDGTVTHICPECMAMELARYRPSVRLEDEDDGGEVHGGRTHWLALVVAACVFGVVVRWMF